MKKSGIACCLFAVAIAAAGGARAQAQTGARTTPGQPNPQRQQTLIRSVEGVDLYRAYCVACHGTEGKGNGPVAPALRAKVPDLTMIAKNNGGQFPAARVRRILMGEDTMASHGSREMPVWGPLFHDMDAPVDRGPVRLDNLVKYLESIQVGMGT